MAIIIYYSFDIFYKAFIIIFNINIAIANNKKKFLRQLCI